MLANDALRLDPNRLSQAADLLGAAFLPDPSFFALQPDETKRHAVLKWLFIRLVRYAMWYGQVYTTPRLEGIACWLPPGRTKLSWPGLLRSGLATIPFVIGLPALLRYYRIMGYVDRLHARYAPPDHWYLWILGVAPVYQRQGIGGRLLQPIRAQAGAEGIACYLETDTEGGVRFYQRHSFRVMEQGAASGSGMKVWAMLRPPEV
jgi:ribosomal protein S18 acetylase RimI-like enzyme